MEFQHIKKEELWKKQDRIYFVSSLEARSLKCHSDLYQLITICSAPANLENE